jgi:hypothetical protein
MSDPKTVSDLPIDTSIRWANDQKLLEESHPIITDSKSISQFTQKDVSVPAPASHLDVLLDITSTHPTWALFSPPAGFFNQRRRLFTSRVLPLFDSEDLIDDKIQKVTSVLDQEEDKENSRGNQEKEALIKMLRQLIAINKNLLFIMSRRNQYQKG